MSLHSCCVVTLVSTQLLYRNSQHIWVCNIVLVLWLVSLHSSCVVTYVITQFLCRDFLAKMSLQLVFPAVQKLTTPVFPYFNQIWLWDNKNWQNWKWDLLHPMEDHQMVPIHGMWPPPPLSLIGMPPVLLMQIIGVSLLQMKKVVSKWYQNLLFRSDSRLLQFLCG